MAAAGNGRVTSLARRAAEASRSGYVRTMMKTDNTTVLLAVNSLSEEPTPASIWHALAGSSFTEDILEWPADLFALTNVILKRTEAYRFVFSPPSGEEWPPGRFSNWSEAVEEAGRFMQSPTRPAQALAWPLTDPTERDVYIARVDGSCWRERARWLESNQTQCACFPKSVPRRMAPRSAHSHVTHACKVPA